VPLDRQVAEELLDLGGAPITWVAFMVEVDEPGDPWHVAGLGAPRVVPDAQHLPDLVEQAGRPGQGQFAQLEVQHLAVKEIEGVAGRSDRPDGILLGVGDGLQELTDLRKFQLARVAFAVEQDRASAPGDEASHGRLVVPALPRGLAQLV
jgi:hypothetical protein